ncbi:hypothetical protein LINPERPRIM_LOCUS617 [Linum perenne]
MSIAKPPCLPFAGERRRRYMQWFRRPSAAGPAAVSSSDEAVDPLQPLSSPLGQVYSFIGSVLDPDTKGHVRKRREMDPINYETVMLLMKNLSMNLSSPRFELVKLAELGEEECFLWKEWRYF